MKLKSWCLHNYPTTGILLLGTSVKEIEHEEISMKRITCVYIPMNRMIRDGALMKLSRHCLSGLATSNLSG